MLYVRYGPALTENKMQLHTRASTLRINTENADIDTGCFDVC